MDPPITSLGVCVAGRQLLNSAAGRFFSRKGLRGHLLLRSNPRGSVGFGARELLTDVFTGAKIGSRLPSS